MVTGKEEFTMAKMTKEQKQRFIREFPGNRFSSIGRRMGIPPSVLFEELLKDEKLVKSCEEADRQRREEYKKLGYKVNDNFPTLSEQLENWRKLKKDDR